MEQIKIRTGLCRQHITSPLRLISGRQSQTLFGGIVPYPVDFANLLQKVRFGFGHVSSYPRFSGGMVAGIPMRASGLSAFEITAEAGARRHADEAVERDAALEE